MSIAQSLQCRLTELSIFLHKPHYEKPPLRVLVKDRTVDVRMIRNQITTLTFQIDQF